MFPTIPTVADGRVLTAVQANQTASRTFPNLSSLTKNAGDLLLAIIYAFGGTATSNFFGSWGASFTESADVGDSLGHCFGVAYKWSDGTESGTFGVTQAGTPNGQAAMALMSIPGVDPTSIPTSSGTYTSATASAANPGTLSPGWGTLDILWISVAGIGETSTAGSFTALSTPPTNYGNDVQSGISADVVGGVELGVAFRQLNGASEDVGTWTLDTSNTRNAALVIAIRPAPEIPYMSMHPQSPKQFPDRSVRERRVW